MPRNVVLDPGHGGAQRRGNATPDGARFENGQVEKQVNYVLAQSVARHLGGAHLTRGAEEARSHGERIQVARRYGADAFVSLHTSPGGGGNEVWVHPRSGPQSRELAEAIRAQLSPAFGGRIGPVSCGELAVLSPEHHAPRTAACLLDLGYHGSYGRPSLAEPGGLEAAAAAIARGVLSHLGGQSGGQRLPVSAVSGTRTALGRGGPVLALEGEFRAGSVADQVARAMPAAPDVAPGMELLHYILEIVEGVEVGLGIAGVELGVGALGAAGVLGALGLTIEVAGPLAGAAALFIALGLPYAEAVNELMRDQMASGFSLGVVLGADDRPPAYLTEQHFVKYDPVPNAFLPEYGRKLQQAYNQALIAGYVQGRALLRHASQRAAFFDDLTRQTVLPGGEQETWSDREYRNMYVDLAITFRKHHLEGA